MDIQDYAGLIISFFSLILSIFALILSWRTSSINRMNTNIWEIYRLYNSEDIKRARITVRTLAQDAAWQSVRALSSYQTYFQLGAKTEAGQDEALKTLWQQELDVHSMLGFYHQVGLLLKRKLVDEDFIMLLLGGGLEERWEVLGRIPHFYPDHPYRGMDALYERYCLWKGRHLPREERKK